MQFITPLGSKASLLLWYHCFFLDKATTPYSLAMNPFNPANTAGSRDLGNELDVLATFNMDARNSLLLGYSFFVAGKYYILRQVYRPIPTPTSFTLSIRRGFRKLSR